MAYKQSPGRMAMPKTGRGISPAMMSSCGSPMKQTNKQLTPRERDIERAAASDSTMARREAFKKSKGSMSTRELGNIGNKAANATRKVNESTIRVEKEKKQNPVTGERAFKRTRTISSPMKQKNSELTPRERDIERAAASDSTVARREAFKKEKGSLSKRQLGEIGNKAANATRKANESTIRVEKEKKQNPITGERAFKRTRTK